MDSVNTPSPSHATQRKADRTLAGRGLAQAEKKANREGRTLIFIDEAGFYLLPGVVRTYAPEGMTPTLYEWHSRDHLSVMGGITPAGKLYTLVRPVSLKTEHNLAFLEHLVRQMNRKLLVIWDGSPIHRGGDLRAYLAGGGAKWVHLESLPPYAPELNPTEGVWQHLKHVELRNLCCWNLNHLYEELQKAIARLRQKPRLIQSFFTETGLTL